MKKGKKIYVRKDLVSNKELSELDFDLYDEFNVDTDNEDELIIIDSIRSESVRKRYQYYVDTTPLKITDLEKLITNFKKKGATHIAMIHHSDHHGYEFSGFNIELTDNELISKYEAEMEKKCELMKKYNSLNMDLIKIIAEIKDLKV